MIPVSNSYRLSENLANAVLLTYPDAGHGSLFQYPGVFYEVCGSVPVLRLRVGRVLNARRIREVEA